MAWPVQSKCTAFYGNPRGGNGGPSRVWEAAHLTVVPCPWVLRYDGKPVKGIRVHKKAAESLARVLEAIWVRVGRSQAEIDRIGMSIYGGAYNFRLMRGGSSLSMHSWGCAIDFDPERNGLGDKTPAMDRRVIEEFEREGWEWGGHWSRPDGMHFQAAWSRANPPRLRPAAPAVRPVAPPVTAPPPPAPMASASILTATEGRVLATTVLGGGAVGKTVSDTAAPVPAAPPPVPEIEQLKQASEHVGIVQSLTNGVTDLLTVLGANPWLWGLILAGGAYVGLRIYRRRAGANAAEMRPVVA
jgi:hypothetical protein